MFSSFLFTPQPSSLSAGSPLPSAVVPLGFRHVGEGWEEAARWGCCLPCSPYPPPPCSWRCQWPMERPPHLPQGDKLRLGGRLTLGAQGHLLCGSSECLPSLLQGDPALLPSWLSSGTGLRSTDWQVSVLVASPDLRKGRLGPELGAVLPPASENEYEVFLGVTAGSVSQFLPAGPWLCSTVVGSPPAPGSCL